MNKIKWCSALCILFVVAIVSNAQSQIQVYGTQSMVEKLRLNKSIQGISNTYYSEIEGDPYLYKEFTDGAVTMKNEEVFKAQLRYDIKAGEIQFKDNDEVYALINQEEIERIEIKKMKFMYSEYGVLGDNAKIKTAYFEVLAEGDFILLAKKNIRIQDPEPPKLYTEAKPAKFIILADSYYIKNNDSPAVRIKTKKDFKTYFEDKAQGVTEFAKTQKLAVSKKDDLIQIVDFANKNTSK